MFVHPISIKSPVGAVQFKINSDGRFGRVDTINFY